MTHKNTGISICMLIYNFYPNTVGGAEKQCRLQAHELVCKGHSCIVLTARTSWAQKKIEVDGGVYIVRINTMQCLIHWILTIRDKVGFKKRDTSNSASRASTDSEDKQSKASGVLEGIVSKLCSLSFMAGSFLYLWKNKRTIDVIHTHIASWNAGFSRWAGHILNIPAICKASNLPAFDNFSNGVLFARIWKKWRKLIPYIALTDEIAECLLKEGVERQNIHIIPNGVKVPGRIAPVRTNSRVLYVGNLSQGNAHKGFDTLIHAWAKVHESIPKAMLMIAGQGDPTRWTSMATELHCASSIQFTGYVSELSRYYLDAAVFVLPSRFEGISNALLEAQSFGVPAIVSNIPGNRAVMGQEQAGLIVPVGDSEALSLGIIQLLENPATRERMSIEARKNIHTNFEIGGIVDKHIKLYEKLLLHYFEG